MPRFILGNFERWLPVCNATHETDNWGRQRLRVDYEPCWVFDQQSGRRVDIESMTYLPLGDDWFRSCSEYPENMSEHIQHASSEVFCAVFTPIVRAFPDFTFADANVGDDWLPSIDRLRPDIAASIRKQLLSTKSTPYKVIGVERASGMDVVFRVEAASEANARVKSELRGVIVTSVREDYPHVYSSRQDPIHTARLIQQQIQELESTEAINGDDCWMPLDAIDPFDDAGGTR